MELTDGLIYSVLYDFLLLKPGCFYIGFFFFKQKTAYEMRIGDWSSAVCSSDLATSRHPGEGWGYGVSCGPASATIDASALSWAIVDIANFYVSAERLFDPALRDVPVIVLSNNDGCAIARSEEAKALHVRMGDPVFKMRDRIKRHGIQLRSSNYELYADLNRRFNAVIADHSDMVEIYSIDESFFRLPVLPDGLGNVVAAHAVREDIARSVGLPTRIGLGPTRTLSKVANALAKATEKVWGGVVDLHDVELRRRLFDQWPVGEVWGIGHALAARLRPLGVKTTADLAALPPAVARDVGTVVLERLVRELGGIECDDFKVAPEPLQATAVTRQFGGPDSALAEQGEANARTAPCSAQHKKNSR